MAESVSPAEKVLVVFDFDWSLVEGNTDTWVTDLGGQEAHDLQEGYGKPGFHHTCWTDLMDEVLEVVHRHGASKKAIEEHMCKMVIHPDMLAVCALIASRPEVDCFVLSDSNSVFIDVLLEHYKLKDVVKRVVTNPAQFDSDGRLHVQHCHAHTCQRCEPNLCKGQYMDEFLAAITYSKVVYIGDGRGDVCPSLRLSANDSVLARKGYSLFKILQSTGGVRASVIPWCSGADVLHWFEQDLRVHGQ